MGVAAQIFSEPNLTEMLVLIQSPEEKDVQLTMKVTLCQNKIHQITNESCLLITILMTLLMLKKDCGKM